MTTAGIGPRLCIHTQAVCHNFVAYLLTAYMNIYKHTRMFQEASDVHNAPLSMQCNVMLTPEAAS